MSLIDRKGLEQTTGLASWKVSLLLVITRITALEKRYLEVGSPTTSQALLEAIYSAYNIEIQYDQAQLSQQIPASGAFFTVSNHPFGFLDGTTLLKEISQLRPNEFLVVANFLLAFFNHIRDFFITVNPFEQAGPKGMGGTRKCLEAIESGQGVGLFPAGEISTWYKGKQGVQDKDWSLSSMKLILKAKAPVIPIYFCGSNSLTFHILGKIHPIFRTLRIAIEYLKKKNGQIRFKTGERIPYGVIEDMTPEELRDFLRAKVYELSAQP